ncbi:uncharacterized protein LOC125049285 [Pieris napi]|uniref:uncharacterized protein LOC125049285 n=1 Tax=Pieris napi TaxID=78633 RepID=UPI001FB8A1CE|nr:uncharacterized protein LOC125049285 [Pieris napi]
MNKPPDLGRGDDGLVGLNLPVGSNVSVGSQDEFDKMDTDCSVSSQTGEGSRKRTRYLRLCRQCTKIKKKKGSGSSGDYCQCESLCNVEDESILIKKVTSKPISQSTSSPHLQNNNNSHSTSSRPSTSYTENSNISQDSNAGNLNNTTTSVTNTDPRSIGRAEYVSTDVSPYFIHVQRIQSSPDDGTILHPITFGNFLKQKKFNNIIPGSVKRIGRNRCVVGFSDYKDANNFLNCNLLETKKLKAFIPTFSVTRMGLVRGVPVDWSVEEVQQNVSVPIGCGKILKIRRLNRKVKINDSVSWKPSESVVLTFDGQVLPKRIFMCYNALPVEIYIYPTIQCYKCCRYGHTKVQCRSKTPICYNCGGQHAGVSCDRSDKDPLYCVMCEVEGSHSAIDKSCPEFVRQTEIKVKMAQSCMSYAEASKYFSSIKPSYADALSSTIPEVPKPVNPSAAKSVSRDNSTNASNKKTIFLKPRSPRKPQHGYDRVAHYNVLKDFQVPEPKNGSALVGHKNKEEEKSDVLEMILALLTSLINSNLLKPSHVASINEKIKSVNVIKNNGFQDNSMELQECCSKET